MAGAGGVARGRAPGVERVPARVAAVTDRCYVCRAKVRGIVGVLVDPRHTADRTGFIALEHVADQLVGALDRRVLAARGVGELRHRDSPGIAGGYIANGCPNCDALIGRFQLEDLLAEHIARGGVHAQLDVGIGLEIALPDRGAQRRR